MSEDDGTVTIEGAREALRILGVTDDALDAAMTGAHWPARMQRLRRGPLFDIAPSGCELWLDGGHNPAAGEALARLLADMEERDPKPLHMICGMLNTKDISGYLSPLAGVAHHLYAVAIL